MRAWEIASIIAVCLAAGNTNEAIRGVMIQALDMDPESDFLLFGESRSGFRSSKKQNHKTSVGVMIPPMDPDSDPVKRGIITPIDSETYVI